MGVHLTRRSIATNGVKLHVIECGPPKTRRPPVLLVHGWPELSHSWRHQLPFLGERGWHTLAPDMRGYGRSDCPDGIDPYRIDELAADLIGILDSLGEEKGVLVGHDWGSIVVWEAAKLHPERIAGVVGMSVPYTPWPIPPTQLFEAASGGDFFYILHFQEPGVAEAELDADPERSLRMTYFSAGAEGMDARAAAVAAGAPTSFPRSSGFLDTMIDPLDQPGGELPPWLDGADLDHYAREFAHSGFRGGITYYRNFDANFAVSGGLGPDLITMPSAFIAGTKDPVMALAGPNADAHPDVLPDFRGNTMIEGAGHWVQQEAPDEVNAALLAFLQGL